MKMANGSTPLTDRLGKVGPHSQENRYISVKLKFAPAQTEEINDDDLVIMLKCLAV
jgi:ribosomal protein L15